MEIAGASLLIAASYLVGAVPWGVVLGRLMARTDLRDHGSRSTGATNAYRVLGKNVAIGVLVLDFAKGLAPVMVARSLGLGWWVTGAVAVAAVIGHCWSPFIGFDGGKGVATGGGALIAMLPWLVVVVPVMALVVVLTRFVSLGSLVAAIFAVALTIIASSIDRAPVPAAIAATIIAAIVVYRHRENIRRLKRGTENRFGVPTPVA